MAGGGYSSFASAVPSASAPLRNLRASSMAPHLSAYSDARSALSPERQLHLGRGLYSPLREVAAAVDPYGTIVNGGRATAAAGGAGGGASMAGRLIVQPGSGGYSTAATSSKRFMTLEDECNWILSGREPLPDDQVESDQDDDTLDDISGDEVDFFCRATPNIVIQISMATICLVTC